MSDMRLFKPDVIRCARIWSTRHGDDDRTCLFVGCNLGVILLWSDGSKEIQDGSIYIGDGHPLFDGEEPYDWPEDWPPRDEVERSLIRLNLGNVDLLGVVLRSSEIKDYLSKLLDELDWIKNSL